MKTKKCRECGRELPLSEFNKNSCNKDGIQDRCRECFSKYNAKRYASNKDKFKADILRYKRDNPEKVLETRLKTCRRNPTRKNAYRAVEAALKCGALVKPDVCSGCGRPASESRVEAHHHDYSKPLDVVWVCSKCHYRLDDMRRAREAEIDSKEGR